MFSYLEESDLFFYYDMVDDEFKDDTLLFLSNEQFILGSL